MFTEIISDIYFAVMFLLKHPFKHLHVVFGRFEPLYSYCSVIVPCKIFYKLQMRHFNFLELTLLVTQYNNGTKTISLLL